MNTFPGLEKACVEFIYKEPGVNRSLRPKDKEKKKLKVTLYLNQINKVDLSKKEIISGMIAWQTDTANEKISSHAPWVELSNLKLIRDIVRIINILQIL
jgi:hypothetical protein